jgi:hypothetical protein
MGENGAGRGKLERSFLTGFDRREMMIGDLKARIDRINAERADDPVEPDLADALLQIIRAQGDWTKALEARISVLEHRMSELPR